MIVEKRIIAQIGGSRAFACAHTVTRLCSGISAGPPVRRSAAAISSPHHIGPLRASEGRYVVRELEHGWRLGRRLVHEACLRIDVGSDGITYLERFDPTPVAIPLSPF